MNSNLLTWGAVAAVGCYYGVVWIRVGRDPKRGIIVTRYEPPQGLSPSMLRFVWKETFDDRTFWAGMLSLVAKGLATLETEDDVTLARATAAAKRKLTLPKEERFLLARVLHRHGQKGVPMNMLDDETAYAASQMAGVLRQAAVGRWFLENRENAILGAVLSFIPVYLSARPENLNQWIALGLVLGVMAPGGFYLVFVLLRLADLVRGSRKGPRTAIVRRALMLFAMIVPCVAALTLGSVLLGAIFGWQVLLVTALMIGLYLVFVHLMKAPTAEGRKLLDEIDGFRQFLKSVEKFPMDRLDAPTMVAGTYERYLPYAIALEVEQAWSDRFLAFAETAHEREFLPDSSASAFYLGMWDGKPVEVVWMPQPPPRPRNSGGPSWF